MLSKVSNHRLLIPIELLEHTAKHQLYKPCLLYIYLKCHSSGKVKSTDPIFHLIKTLPGFEDRRTLTKHLKTLLDLNWIGYNAKSSIYFIRNFKSIQTQYGITSRKSVLFLSEYINNFRPFVSGALISAKIYGVKFSYEVARVRRLNTALNKKDGAKQCYSYDRKAPEYYGLSNKGIAKLLNSSQTVACEQKTATEKAGFILTKGKFKVLLEFTSVDRAIRSQLEELKPEFKGRLRFKKNGSKIQLLIQLHDEIIPQLKMKSRKKIARENFLLHKKPYYKNERRDFF